MTHAPSDSRHESIAAPPAERRWQALALLCVAQFMVILDVTVVNVALPPMAADLGLDRTALTWAVTAYTLCFGGLLLLGGRFADLLGRRRVFLTGLLLFTTASLLAGLADDAATLLSARAAQGVGAALLSPAALSIITSTFHGADRNRALGIWAALGGSGAAAGVLLGGVLSSGPGWRWVFFINVPIGALVALLVTATVATSPRQLGRLDVPGAALVTAASAALIYGLVEAGDSGWTAVATLAPIAAAAALYTAFAAVQRSSPAALLPLHLLTQRATAAGVAVMLAASALLISGFFLSSLVLQGMLGLSAMRTGVLFLPVAFATIVGAGLTAHLIGKAGTRVLAAAGFALAAGGFAMLAMLDANASAWTDVLPGFVLAAAGLGMGFVIATTTALAAVDSHHAGTASGVINTAHELGAALGIAVVSTIAATAIHAGSTTSAMSVTATAGFTDAFRACAIAAAVAAILMPLLLPAGRPAAPDRPMFAH